jgi:hypothetical protein
MIRKTVTIATALVLVSMVTGCAPKHTTAASSGVSGRVLVSGGPLLPNNLTATPRPLADTSVRATDTHGTVAAATTTGTNGRFTMMLTPGTYRLQAPNAVPVSVVVRAGAYAHVTIQIEVP